MSSHILSDKRLPSPDEMRSYDDYTINEGLSASEAMQISFAGKIGNFLEPVFRPLGFDWPIVIGIFAAFAAREVFVSALATFYSIENSDAAAKSLTDFPLASKKVFSLSVF